MLLPGFLCFGQELIKFNKRNQFLTAKKSLHIVLLAITPTCSYRMYCPSKSIRVLRSICGIYPNPCGRAKCEISPLYRW